MKPRVIVIGAGVSGLAAARTLCDSGKCDVIILEAETRTGGRVNTIEFHGQRIELGAQWVHGSEGNAAYEVLSKELEEKCLEKREDKPITVKYASGKEVEPQIQSLCEESQNILDMAYAMGRKKLSRLWVREKKMKSVPAIKLIEKIWKNELLDQSSSHLNTKPVFENALKLFHEEDGIEPHRTGCLAYLHYHLYEPDVVIVPGTIEFVKILEKSIPKSSIKLGCKVKRINWQMRRYSKGEKKRHRKNVDVNTETRDELQIPRSGEKIMIEYVTDGATVTSLCTDYVIITISIGCLKKYHKELFLPHLPSKKQQAIEKIGFGTVNKVYLHYKNAFWKDSSFSLHFLWDSYPEKDAFSDLNHWCRELRYIEVVNANTLITWVNEKASQAVAKISKQEISSDLTSLLKKFLNDVTIPHPDDVIVTNWDENDNFLGSYSFVALGQTKKTRKIAAEPLYVEGIPKVLFAGEYAHDTRFSAIDGAYQTGVREAQKILSYI